MEIKTHQDFCKKLYELGDEFVLAKEQLAEKLKTNAWVDEASGWVNFDVQSFLHAIARYIEDMAQLTEENAVFPQNVIKNIDDIDWQRFYQFIVAGKGYE
ncbi:DUF7660 family protein [Bartonella sp. HY761]|uniref:DUF7660 family protein n=1 Tax=Bartonella sp. HY761 TaxID=2979330 RepID=UPI0021FF56A5|nr:hypothetical protein [Bartonella sp. HY761]UXN05734.1 hypothetical protein N6A79_10590 [Bartonella sp. HY761]